MWFCKISSITNELYSFFRLLGVPCAMVHHWVMEWFLLTAFSSGIHHINKRYATLIFSWCLRNFDNKGIHLHSQFRHNLFTMWVTMWEEFRSHCDSQYQMTSEFFSQSIHILLNIFWERRNSSARKIVPLNKHCKNVNFGQILKKFLF